MNLNWSRANAKQAASDCNENRAKHQRNDSAGNGVTVLHFFVQVNIDGNDQAELNRDGQKPSPGKALVLKIST